MGRSARRKWETRYRSGDVIYAPSSFVETLDRLLPPPAPGDAGRALDVAGGAGRHAIWLAERGHDVTLVDIAPTALELARDVAHRRGITVHTVELDLEQEPLPEGPWGLILCFHYLQRDLFPPMIDRLGPGGHLAFAIGTTINHELHDRPPLPFLLDPGEAPSLVPGLDIVSYAEGWMDTGRHEARVVARKGPTGPA